METLLFAVIGLFRRPHTMRKISFFALVVAASFIAAHLLSYLTESAVLAFLAKWLWLPLSVAYMICRYGEPLKRRRLKQFFRQIKFWGVDGKLPQYINVVTVNRYLVKSRFKSRIHISKWEKIEPELESFFNSKITLIQNERGSMTMTEIFVIQEELPTFIEWRDEYMLDGRKFAIGEAYRGKIVWDAAAVAHGLIAGATGGGKTVLARCIIHQAILKRYNVQVFDFKNGGDYSGVEREYYKYRDLESGYGPFVVSKPQEAMEMLLMLINEVRRRLDCFKEAGVSNIDEYNAIGWEHFIPWLIVIDEAAEVLDVKPHDKAEKEMYAEINQSLRTLARMSRAAGVHILMCFIRPSHDVLDGQVKNNLLLRVCAYFQDPAASRIVLDNDRATELPPEVKGRFIVGEDEVQAYYLPIPAKTSANDDL